MNINLSQTEVQHLINILQDALSDERQKEHEKLEQLSNVKWDEIKESEDEQYGIV